MLKNVFPKIEAALIFLLLVAITAVSNACSSQTSVAQQPSASEIEPPPLKAMWSNWPGDYTMILASELGLFEKYGVEVELVYNEIYNTTLALFAAGVVDTFNCTIGDALLLTERVNLRVVMVADSSNGADAVMATRIIHSFEDLRGKRFGVNVGSTMGELFVQEMLKANGMSMADVVIVNMPPEDVPETLGWKIDAGHTWAPYTQRAESLGYKSIFTSADLPGLFPDVMPFREAVLQERPQDVRAFVVALLEAAAYWMDNLDEGNQIIASYTGLPIDEISPEGIKIYTLDDNQVAFTPGSETTSLYTSAQINLDYMVNTGAITRLPEIEGLLDASYLK